MHEKKLFSILKKFEKDLPHFPDGRINYRDAKIAAVMNCTVCCKGKILLLKRSKRVRHYKGKWNTIGGYLDEFKTIKQKAMEEIKEELGLDKKDIKKIEIFEPRKSFDRKIERTWVVFPVLAELKKMKKIKLDWEHTRYKWISPKEMKKFDIVPGVEKVVIGMIRDRR